jgi:hypothetical protein
MRRPEAEAGEDLLVGLQAHVDHPVDGQQGEDEVGDQKDRPLLEATLIHGRPPSRFAQALHPVVEHETEQQDDEEVDQREGRRGAEVELADRLLRQVLRQEGGGVAGPAAGEHEGLGVDHEAVHEAQQHRDHQHAAHLGQLDVAEYRELAGTVDARGLVIRVRDAAQAGVGQQRHQRRPVPHVHQQHGQPGVGGVAGVAVVDAQRLQAVAHQADVGAAEDLPDRTDHVPGDQQRQRDDHQRGRGLPAGGRHRQRQHDAQRNLHQQHRQRELQLVPQRSVQVLVAHHLHEPLGADKDAPLRVDDVLHRVVHHRHQRQDGREGHADEHRQDQEPGLLVHRLVLDTHATSSSFL